MDTKAIMVEFVNDQNEWAWYGVYVNGTEEDALRSYAEGQGIDLDQGITQQKSVFYLGEDARSYAIDLIDLKE